MMMTYASATLTQGEQHEVHKEDYTKGWVNCL